MRCMQEEVDRDIGMECPSKLIQSQGNGEEGGKEVNGSDDFPVPARKKDQDVRKG